MSDPADTSTCDALTAMAAALVAVHRSDAQVGALYTRACRVVGDRCASILRRHVDPQTLGVAEPIPADDRALLATVAAFALRLAAFGRGEVVLSAAELEEMIQRS